MKNIIPKQEIAFLKVFACINTTVEKKHLPSCYKLLENFEKLYGGNASIALRNCINNLQELFDCNEL